MTFARGPVVAATRGIAVDANDQSLEGGQSHRIKDIKEEDRGSRVLWLIIIGWSHPKLTPEPRPQGWLVIVVAKASGWLGLDTSISHFS